MGLIVANFPQTSLIDVDVRKDNGYNECVAEIDSALMYEILKALQTGQSQMQTAMRNLAAEVRITNGHVVSLVQGEVHSTGRIAELEARLERIERRLDLSSGE